MYIKATKKAERSECELDSDYLEHQIILELERQGATASHVAEVRMAMLEPRGNLPSTVLWVPAVALFAVIGLAVACMCDTMKGTGALMAVDWCLRNGKLSLRTVDAVFQLLQQLNTTVGIANIHHYGVFPVGGEPAATMWSFLKTKWKSSFSETPVYYSGMIAGRKLDILRSNCMFCTDAAPFATGSSVLGGLGLFSSKEKSFRVHVLMWVTDIMPALSLMLKGQRQCNFVMFNAGRKVLLPILFTRGNLNYGPDTLDDLLVFLELAPEEMQLR
jgi:hypothetical protein